MVQPANPGSPGKWPLNRCMCDLINSTSSHLGLREVSNNRKLNVR